MFVRGAASSLFALSLTKQLSHIDGSHAGKTRGIQVKSQEFLNSHYIVRAFDDYSMKWSQMGNSGLVIICWRAKNNERGGQGLGLGAWPGQGPWTRPPVWLFLGLQHTDMSPELPI